MIKPKKAIAYLTLYSVISIFVSALAIATSEKVPPIDYFGIIAGAFIGIGILSIIMSLAVWSINEVHK